MTKEEAKKRIEKLRKEINRHRYLYHVLDRQEISDAALDSLKKELFDLETQFPEFITHDSPTQRVGGMPLEKFEKVRHSVPMFSFTDAFSEDDMKEWEIRIKKLEPHATPNYYCELKIDGLAVSFTYRDSVFLRGATRGDGRVGENVTQNLKTIEAIPLTLLDKEEAVKNLTRFKQSLASEFKKKYHGALEARGEVFLTRKEFERMNKEKIKQGLAPFANPRNIAAGSVRQLDPKIIASRKLDSFAYALVTDLGQKTHEDEHIILKALGFKTNPHNEFCADLSDVFAFHARWSGKRERLPYEIDGIVVIVNDTTLFKRFGVVGKAPRGAIAYKFAGKEGTTVVEDINVQVGRVGSLTPVAYLKPVEVGGITISRASLHNEDEIRRLGVKIGDTVIVRRAGDVIPDVVKVLTGLRTGKEREFHMPKQCPICGSKTARPKGEVATYCTNKKCFARTRNAIKYFVARPTFDIIGIGEKIIEQLLHEGLIRDAADLFLLNEGDLLALPRFAETSAKKLIAAIAARKEIDFHRFIYALGITHVGEETAIDLARYFGDIRKLKDATYEDLQRIPNIGGVVAKSVYEWFHDSVNLRFLEKLEEAGVKIKSEKRKTKNETLRGKSFVFTGELLRFTRDEAKAKVRERGGEVSGSISRETDYIVAGSAPGSKYEKAKKLGVKIIGEKEFLQMIR